MNLRTLAKLFAANPAKAKPQIELFSYEFNLYRGLVESETATPKEICDGIDFGIYWQYDILNPTERQKLANLVVMARKLLDRKLGHAEDINVRNPTYGKERVLERYRHQSQIITRRLIDQGFEVIISPPR